MTNDNRAKSLWTRADHAYQNYSEYIKTKPDQFKLTFTDLVYVKNFKGGSAIIAEPVGTIGDKLASYEQLLREYGNAAEFQQTLPELDDESFEIACKRMVDFVSLPNNVATHINGFGESFASALLHFYFPFLVPILDRRSLNGSEIEGLKIDRSSNAVTNLLELYPPLIAYCRKCLRASPPLTLRELDKILFEKKLRVPPFNKKKSNAELPN